MKKQNVIYVAYKLNPEFRNFLVRFTESLCLPCTFHNRIMYCDHITLAYGPKVEDKHIRMLGDVDFGRFLYIYQIVSDEHCIAARIWDRFFNHDAGLHITCATKEGIAPVYSNKLLSSKTVQSYNVNISLENAGQVQAFIKPGMWSACQF